MKVESAYLKVEFSKFFKKQIDVVVIFARLRAEYLSNEMKNLVYIFAVAVLFAGISNEVKADEVDVLWNEVCASNPGTINVVFRWDSASSQAVLELNDQSLAVEPDKCVAVLREVCRLIGDSEFKTTLKIEGLNVKVGDFEFSNTSWSKTLELPECDLTEEEISLLVTEMVGSFETLKIVGDKVAPNALGKIISALKGEKNTIKNLELPRDTILEPDHQLRLLSLIHKNNLTVTIGDHMFKRPPVKVPQS